MDGAEDRAGGRRRCRRRHGHRGHRERRGGGPQFREAEIEQLGARLRQHDIGRFEIAVDDARAVGFVERIGDVNADLQHLFERQRTLGAGQSRRQCLAFEILHHEVVNLLVTADVVDGADVRMRQRGNRSCLALESRAAIRIGGEVGRQHLHRHRAIEPRVTGCVDLAHSAGSKGRNDFVRAEAHAAVEGQTGAEIIRCRQPERRLLLKNGDLVFHPRRPVGSSTRLLRTCAPWPRPKRPHWVTLRGPRPSTSARWQQGRLALMDLHVECGQQCGRTGVIAHQHDEIDQLVGPEDILGLGEGRGRDLVVAP